MTATTASAVAAAADRLEVAATTGVACAPLTDLLRAGDVATAYQVQRRLTRRRLATGRRIVGRKIGITSAAVQRQVGVSQPDFGVLFDDMWYSDGELIPVGRLLQPRIEAEVAFLLAQDIPDPGAGSSSVRDAVGLAFPALEIVDSRIADWRIAITDTIADNASSGVFAVGSVGTPLDAVKPVDVTMTMRRGGAVVSRGTGADCLGDPLNALAWLATTLVEVGTPLRAGDIVLSGALGPMVTVSPGDVFTAEITPLGTVTARFSGKDDQI